MNEIVVPQCIRFDNIKKEIESLSTMNCAKSKVLLEGFTEFMVISIII